MPTNGCVVQAQAPCRADLAGGTLDLWPLYLFHPGALTVNFALSILTTCRIESRAGHAITLRSRDTRMEERFGDIAELCRATSYRHAIGGYLVRHFRPQGGFLLETHSESPAGAGISGSSALMIATTAALGRFTGRKLGHEPMRILAQNVEAQIIKVPTGCQDYYPALYGGLNAIHLDPKEVRREGLAVSAEEIGKRFVLAYTGVPRQSGINNWEVFCRHINADRRVVRNFERISQIAQKMRAALASGDWDTTASLLREEWQLRRSNYPGISTPLIDRLVKLAARNGGVAAKVCGAGGGGCVLFMAQPEARDRVKAALATAGARILDCKMAKKGLRVSVVKVNPEERISRREAESRRK
jgi:D-glycero-alpha-D-manno-heptose-7-phosphate kinase